MFIIPCKFSYEHPYIFECLSAIRVHHPNEMICVVDSNSNHQDYLKHISSQYDVKVLTGNNNYGTNAFAMAYDSYPDQEFYYCIYDSLILQANLKSYEEFRVTAFRYFNTPPTGWGWDANNIDLSIWAETQINAVNNSFMPYSVPKNFHGIFGPMFMAKNEVLWQMKLSGLFDIKPTNKYELCAMERIYGICLEYLGHNFWANSPQGCMTDFWAPYPESKVRKINAARV